MSSSSVVILWCYSSTAYLLEDARYGAPAWGANAKHERQHPLDGNVIGAVRTAHARALLYAFVLPTAVWLILHPI